MKDNKRRNIHPAMGFFGLFGFMGLLGIAFNEPTFYSFFSFFGFFSWYWWGKLSKEQWDERLVANQLRATNKAMGLCFGFVFSGMILSGNFIGSHNTALAYPILIAIVSLGFAAALNLAAYLTWKYDRED